MQTIEKLRTDLTTHPAYRLIAKLGMLMAGIALAALYLWTAHDRWYPTPDSALYLGLGKSIAQGNGYVFNGVTDNTVTPGLPLVVAAVRVLTGGEGIFVLNVLMALCGLLAGWMIYKSIALLENKPMAFAAAICTLVSRPFFESSHRILTDMPFIAAAYLVLYLSLRYMQGGSWRWLAGAALTAVVSLILRAPGAVLLIPMALGFLLIPKRVASASKDHVEIPGPQSALPSANVTRRHSIIMAGCLLVVAVGMTAMWYFWARSISQGVPYVESTMRYVNDFAPHREGRVWQGASKMWENLARIIGGKGLDKTPGMVFSGFIVAGMACMCLRRRFFIPFVVVAYTLIMVVIRRTDLPGRYLTVVTPLYFVAAFYLVNALVSWLSRPLLRKNSAAAGAVAASLVCAAVFVSEAKEIRRMLPECVEWPYTPKFYRMIEASRYVELYAITDLLREQVPRDMLVASEDIRPYHYYGERVMVPLPRVANLTAADADVIYEFYQRSPQIGMFILRFEGPWEFQKRLKALFRAEQAKGVIKRVYLGEKHMIYRRVDTVARASCPCVSGASRP